MNTYYNDREGVNQSKIVSEYFSNNLVMDGSSKEIIKEKQNSSKKSPKTQVTSNKIQKKHNKKVKGQKDIRALIKSKKNELVSYTKDFDLVCKQSGIDVDPEQLQLAIALSISLQDNKSADNNDANALKSLTCNQRRSKIRTTLKEYGFETKKCPSKKVKTYRKHYKLLLVSDKEKQQKIADKYAQTLIRNVFISKKIEETLYRENNINSYLYNLATNVLYDSIKNDEIFYFNDLIPKSLYKKHIFKDWSKIPGRPVSPKVEKVIECFKSTECSQEELDSILSGSIVTAQDIVRRKYSSNSLEFIKSPVVKDASSIVTQIDQQDKVEIELKEGLIDQLHENKSIEDNLIRRSIGLISCNNICNMSPPTNRSCSPDLFDDEVTIIMDSSKEKISLQEELSEKTVTVKEQNVFMDLTNCVDVLNYNNVNFKQNSCLSQGSNKTRLNPNDFMDLTECVPAYVQNTSNNLQSATNYEIATNNDTTTEQNGLKDIDLNQLPHFTNTKTRPIDVQSSDDTIIMIDDEYGNINTENNYSLDNVTSKKIFTMDSVENRYKISNILDATAKNIDSIIDIEHNIDYGTIDTQKKIHPFNIPNNRCITIPEPCNLNGENNSESTKGINYSNTVDLTQPLNVEDCFSLVNIQPPKSTLPYEIRTVSDTISSKNIDFSTNSNYIVSKNAIESAKHVNESSKNVKNLETLDLTQSSSPEDSLQEVLYEGCIFNKSLEDTITLNNEQYVANSQNNELENGESVDYENLHIDDPDLRIYNSNNLCVNSEKTQNPKTDGNHIFPGIIDTDNDLEFDNLLQNVSNSKHNNLQTSELYENKEDSARYNCCITRTTSPQLSGPENSTNKLTNLNGNSAFDFTIDDSHIINVEEESNKMLGNKEKWNDKLCSTEIEVPKHFEVNMKQNQSLLDIDSNRNFNNATDISEKQKCPIDSLKLYSANDIDNIHLENIYNEPEDNHSNQNINIDLTQESDNSEDTLCCPKIVEVPDELGKRNNISIDYDEVCDEASNCGTTLLDNDAIGDKSDHKNGGVSESSQHTEVFDISDNEFNYSINQHIRDHDSLILKQADFDIGVVSVNDELLNRNSLPKGSTLRCSCSSNGEYNTFNKEVETCLPVIILKKNQSLDTNINLERKSSEQIKPVKISTPLKCRSDDDILIAKTPKHDDYIIKTNEITPMPNYENMTSPERDEELDKFGIKPLKRKRAIQILTHIYNQTHPIMEIISNDDSSPAKIRRNHDVESFPRRIIATHIDSLMAGHSTDASERVLDIVEPNICQKSSNSHKELCKNSCNSVKTHKRTKCLDKENTLYEVTALIPDIRNIECSPEDWVFQNREKAKVHSCRVPLHIAFHNYVSCRKALREAILKYEPINIDDIHKGLVAIGYRYKPKDLLRFMDKKCITVKTADNSRNNKNV